MFKDNNPYSIIDFTPEMEKLFHFILLCHRTTIDPSFSIVPIDAETYLILCTGQGNESALEHLVCKSDVNEFYFKNKGLFQLLFNRGQLN